MQSRRSNEPRVTMQPPVTTISAAPGMSNPGRGTGERGDREHAGEPDLGRQQAQQQRHERGPGHSSGTLPSRLAPGECMSRASWPRPSTPGCGRPPASATSSTLTPSRATHAVRCPGAGLPLGLAPCARRRQGRRTGASGPARQNPAPTQPRPAPIESVQDAAPVLLRNPGCIEAHQEYQSKSTSRPGEDHPKP